MACSFSLGRRRIYSAWAADGVFIARAGHFCDSLLGTLA